MGQHDEGRARLRRRTPAPSRRASSAAASPATPETEEEVEIFPRRRAADSTIGLPEKVSQSPLPFGAPAPEEEAEDEEAGDEAAEERRSGT